MLRDSERTTESLEKEAKRLETELKDGQNHPEFPFVDQIPGYIWALDRLSEIEDELDHRRYLDYIDAPYS